MPRAELLAGPLPSKRRGEHPLMSLTTFAHARSENRRGILAMLASMAVFVVNDTLVSMAGLYTFVREQRLARAARP